MAGAAAAASAPSVAGADGESTAAAAATKPATVQPAMIVSDEAVAAEAETAGATAAAAAAPAAALEGVALAVANLKAQGNAYFKAREFDHAVEAFTAAITQLQHAAANANANTGEARGGGAGGSSVPAAAEIHLLYGNRALAYLKAGEIESALRDADAAIAASQRRWPKGHYRRACKSMKRRPRLSHIRARASCRKRLGGWARRGCRRPAGDRAGAARDGRGLGGPAARGGQVAQRGGGAGSGQRQGGG